MNNSVFTEDFLQSENENFEKKKLNYESLKKSSADPILSSSSTSTLNVFSKNLIIIDDKTLSTPLDLTSLHERKTMPKQGTSNRGLPYVIEHKLENGICAKIWKCKSCLKEFRHQYTLMRHLPTHTNERKFECVTCGKAFRQMSTLSQHKVIHSLKRPFVCDVCQKTFNRISTLISHKKIHLQEKPYKCNVCSKAFHQKGNLRNHIFTHTNERPYKCEGCGAGFNQKSNLMCHKQKCHQSLNTPTYYYCQYCTKAFEKRAELRKHERFVHAKEMQAAELFVKNDKKMFNAVFVDPIETQAMQLALKSNKPPFALLRPLTGIPVLVRVLPVKDSKQMLVPANSEDLKKYGQIVVTPKVALPTEKDKQPNFVGSTVQIKIPVVATVIQQNNTDDSVSTSVVSPGPSEKSENYIQNKEDEKEDEKGKVVELKREKTKKVGFSLEIFVDEENVNVDDILFVEEYCEE